VENSSSKVVEISSTAVLVTNSRSSEHWPN